MYHFLGKHKVKGIKKEFYNFANVLKQIAETNKLYNAYNIMKDRIDKKFIIWTTALYSEEVEEMVSEDRENEI